MGMSVSPDQLLPIRPIPIGPIFKLEPSIWALHTLVASTGQRIQSCCFHRRMGGEAWASVRPVEQPPGDDLRLDFGGALENIEDAGVAENPRHREFQLNGDCNI